VSSAATITFRSKSTKNTSYSATISGSEIISFGFNKSIENVTISGSAHTGDLLSINVIDPALSGGQHSVSYTVASGSTLSSIATNLASAVNGDSTLAALGVTATSAANVIAVQSLSSNVTSYS